MRELDSQETSTVAAGRLGILGVNVPLSCSGREMIRAAGFGALAGLTGFAAGPAIGVGTVGFSAIIGGVAQMTICAHDLTAMRARR